jgi:hypothetical protein
MKYFKKIDSFKDLKNKYRDLLKANHPDNGGNVEIMSEINCEYDALFKIWKDKTQDLTEEEKKETASASRRNFYTAFGWAGSRYNSNLTLKEIASICRNYVKTKYPTCKFSIRTHYASMCQSLSVELKEFPAKMYKTVDDLRAEGLTESKTYIDSEGKEVTYQEYTDEVQDMLHRLRVNGYFDLDSWYDNDVFEAYEKALNDSCFYGIKTEYFKSVIDDVNSFVQSYNYNDSDSMTDYFDVNFYDGKVDYSHCKQVEKTARINDNEEKTPVVYDDFEVKKDVDTRDNSILWVVSLPGKIDRDQFNEIRKEMKEKGGYYSRFKKGFIFREDPTSYFKKSTPEESEAIPEKEEKENEEMKIEEVKTIEEVKSGYGYNGEGSNMFTIENIEALKAGENVTLLNSYNNCKKYFVAMKYNIKNVYIVYSSYQGILPGKDLNYSGFIINNQFYNDSELIIDSISGDIEKELKKRIPDTAAATVLFESINKDRYHHLLVEGAKKCDRKHEAKKLFFDDKKPELNIFNRRNDIKLTHVVDYLVDPEKVIDELTSYYIEYFSKDILVSYIIYDSTVAAYNEIKYNSKADHKIKEIIKSLSNEKTLRISLKNGNTIRIESSAINNLKYNGSFSSWYVSASDRKLLDRDSYGHDKDVNIDDIVKISHGRKVLYQAS